MRNPVPRVTLEEAPAIAEQLKQSIEMLGISHLAFAQRADISIVTLERILSGKFSYKRPTLEKIDSAFENDGILSEEKQRRKDWGAKIKKRRKELDLTRAEVSDHIGVSRERIRQIEFGNLTADNLTLAKILPALGYPGSGVGALDKDQPETPVWVAKHREDASAENESKQKIGGAFKLLRKAKGISQSEMAELAGVAHDRIPLIERGMAGDESLQKTLNAVGIKDAAQLQAHVRKIRAEKRDMGPLKDRLQSLYAASRVLRTYWNITGEELSGFGANKYHIAYGTIYALENPDNAYGGDTSPSLDTVIGLITALYNADEKQPSERRTLASSRNAELIANIANKGNRITYGLHFRQLLERAVDDIVTATQILEPSLAAEQPPIRNGPQIGLRHPSNRSPGLHPGGGGEKAR